MELQILRVLAGVCVFAAALQIFRKAGPGLGTAASPEIPVLASASEAAIEHTALNAAARMYDTCFDVPTSICLGGTSQAIVASGIPDDLVAWFTFDELYPVDHSGNGNHMHRAIRAGPGYNGKGASASFVGGANGAIRSSGSIDSNTFTIAFWLYLLREPNGRFRNVISKGSAASQTPTILLYPDTTRVSIRLTTDNSSSEGLPSRGAILLRRWTHLAVSVDVKTAKIFLNGVKDNQTELRGNVIANTKDLHIGPTVENSGFEAYIDDLRIYNRALSEEEIASLAPSGLTGVGDTKSSFLGCAKCSLASATGSNTCGEPAAHLCSLQELYQGAIHTARINGLLSSIADIWHRGMSHTDTDVDETRAALCCRAETLDSIGRVELPAGLTTAQN